MLSCPLKLSTYQRAIHSVPTCIPNFVVYLTYGACVENKKSPDVRLVHFRRYSCRVMHKDIHPVSTPHDVEPGKGEVQFHSSRESFESGDNEKIQGRKPTGHGNKGRVPWNKGQKHSEETRARIKHRTEQALKDPKVRKKMSEAPRALSDQTRVKIRASLTKLWEKRLKWKRARERFLQSWAETIAYAAKVGGPDQQELEWDSYDKLKQEIAQLQILQAEEKTKAKEAACIRARLKAEKMSIVAQKQRERQEKENPRLVRKRKSKEEREKLAEFHEVKLKERLMKIHRKKSTVNRVSNQRQRRWEKVDLNFAKAEESRKEISLADQIRSAKNRAANRLIDKL